MKPSNESESVVPVSRRNVLRAGAVTAVGAGLFSGTASATDPRQINFCGCSQLCLEREPGVGGTFYVVEAYENDAGEWEFNQVQYQGTDSFCHDVEGTEKKIIGIRPRVNNGFLYCNPGRCARDALEAFKSRRGYECANEEDGEPAFGTFDDIDSPGTVEIVHGRCGQPGRTPPGRGRGN